MKVHILCIKVLKTLVFYICICLINRRFGKELIELKAEHVIIADTNTVVDTINNHFISICLATVRSNAKKNL